MSMRVTAITHKRVAGLRLDHQPGDAERIERAQEGGDGAAVSHPPARPAGDQGRSPRRAARAALQSAQGDLRAVRAGHAAHRGLARAARRLDAARRLRENLHRGERGHRSGQYRRGVLVARLSFATRSRTCISRPTARPDTGRNPGRAARSRRILIDATLRAFGAAAGACRRANSWSGRARSGRSSGCLRSRRSRPGTAIRSATGRTIGTVYAQRAVAGQWEESGEETFARRRGGLDPGDAGARGGAEEIDHTTTVSRFAARVTPV